ncbi:uncharacterized protein LOC106468282 [Limulus polyphemus]|uniref:Uncharacterized protein LOC106468282 n=1 Tax=Limulus polyphemus TaxID=6850 RepID=A0ABM1T8W6_LIMPO|nr:uncharacterized protein LOC106468282 [Limulus polyphemus]
MALSKLELKNSSYRLRKLPENIWRKPPLHDCDTLKDAGICDGTLLILEDGSPPKSDEITLLFSVGAGAGDQADFEVNIEKQASISQCLKSMLRTAEIEVKLKLKIKKVEKNAEENSEDYQVKILTPQYCKEILSVHGLDTIEVLLHQDRHLSA